MSYNEHRPPSEDEQNTNGSKFDLWFYQRRGDRYYLRLTGLSVALIFIPTALAISSIIIFYVYQRNTPQVEPNVTITPRASESTPMTTVIRPAPPAPTPPKINQQSKSLITPHTTPFPSDNTPPSTPISTPIPTTSPPNQNSHAP